MNKILSFVLSVVIFSLLFQIDNAETKINFLNFVINFSVSDSLIKGKIYVFGTKQKKQYEGKFIKSDSASYTLDTKEGTVKLLRKNVIIYKEVNNNKDSITQSWNFADTIRYVKIITKDGNEAIGQIIAKDSLSVTLRTQSGVTMQIPTKEIVNITQSTIEYEDGEYYIKDPNDSRLFIGPTARPVRAKSGYLSVAELFFPIAAVGFADIVSIAGGISIIPYSGSQLVYVNLKLTPFRSQYFDLAGGYMYINGTSSKSSGYSIAYTGTTFGTKKISGTAGIGYAFGNETQMPIILFGGELRGTSNSKLIMENWIFANKDAPSFTFAGIRFFGSEIAVDFALLKVWDKDLKNTGWPFFPYVSFTYNLDLN